MTDPSSLFAIVTATLEVQASAPPAVETTPVIASTLPHITMAQVQMTVGGESSSRDDPLLAGFVAQLFDNFFRSLRAAVKTVLDGSTISAEGLKKIFSYHIEGLRVLSGDSRVAPLVGLVESFVRDAEQLRELGRVDLSPQIEEELNRLRSQNQDKLQAVSKRLEDLKADLGQIRGNASMTAQDLKFSQEQAALHHSNIRKAEETIRTAQALIQISNNGLREEIEKQKAFAAMTAKLQQEEEAKAKEIADSEIELGKEISLSELALREQAVANATENHRAQLAAIRATLLAYNERQL